MSLAVYAATLKLINQPLASCPDATHETTAQAVVLRCCRNKLLLPLVVKEGLPTHIAAVQGGSSYCHKLADKRKVIRVAGHAAARQCRKSPTHIAHIHTRMRSQQQHH